MMCPFHCPVPGLCKVHRAAQKKRKNAPWLHPYPSCHINIGRLCLRVRFFPVLACCCDCCCCRRCCCWARHGCVCCRMPLCAQCLRSLIAPGMAPHLLCFWITKNQRFRSVCCRLRPHPYSCSSRRWCRRWSTRLWCRRWCRTIELFWLHWLLESASPRWKWATAITRPR